MAWEHGRVALERLWDSTPLTLQLPPWDQGVWPGCFPEKSRYPRVVASDRIEGTWCSHLMAS